MKNQMAQLLLVLQLISVCIGVNPCVDYAFIYMADGLRSSDFDSSNSDVSLCDAYLDPDTWYRLEHDAGNKLIERPVEPWYCGTQAPIWMNGTHPTDMSEVTAGVCATFSSENICGWSGTVRIRRCNESGSNYFVYLLAVPPGCPLAYCVDAASRKECIPPEVWLEDKFRCGVSETTTEQSTVPLTKPTTLTTLTTTSSPSTERQSLAPTSSPSTERQSLAPTSSPSTERQSLAPTSSPSTERQSLAPTSSPSTERQSLAPTSSSSTERQSPAPTLIPSTEPASSGWSKWGPWSVCSKPCDYGYQSRRRTCGQLPCEGPANTYRLCNEYNCQSLPEEKTRGIGLFFQDSKSKEDTMLTVVLNQPKLHDIIRKNINDICSQNVSMCCGCQYNGISPVHQEFVLSSDIHQAQGSMKPRTDNTVYYQFIAIVNEDIDRTICKGHSQRNYRRQVESSPNFLSFDIMMMASVKSADNIFQVTGLIVTAYVDPATVIEGNDDYDDNEEDEGSSSSLTCVLPIVLCISLVLAAFVIGGFCFARSRPKLKSKTEPDVQSSDPPHYEDLRVNRGLAYIVPPLPSNVIHNVYDTLADQESMDFQKRDLDV